jgi:ATP-dependent DNA helicase DinG
MSARCQRVFDQDPPTATHPDRCTVHAVGSDVRAVLERVTRALPGGGEDRPGQVEMAEAVAKAIEQERHLVVQAGTGTGKSLAYLVPAILAGKKTVVATATKALQDQLAGKDLPFLAPLLASALGREVSYVVLKGRANYLCRQRAVEVMGGGDQLLLDDQPGFDAAGAALGPLGLEIRRLVQWAETATTGDRADLPTEPTPTAWSTLSVSAMECPGAANCPSGDTCFAEHARRRAIDADLVVVNTHLYGTHLASGGHSLPPHEVVIFDEAHQLEDVASTSLGLELGAGRFRALARNGRPVAKDPASLEALAEAGDRFERALGPWRGQRLPAGLGADLAAVVATAAVRVNAAASGLRTGPEGGLADDLTGRRARAIQAVGHLAGDLALIADLPDSHVAWVEGPEHQPVLKVAPIDLQEALTDALWRVEPERPKTAVLTSATIPPRLGERLGMPAVKVDELDAGSPFNYAEQALLYCAAHLPDPRQPGFTDAAHDELEALIRAAGGRTLALFTSWRAMEAAADALRPRLPYRVFVQSELPKPALVAAFTSEETSCLFATMGFWQGLDVPGPALSLVAIDRVPFPRPDNPLLQARRDRLGQEAFRLVDLPRAATLLAQGVGRLIRSSSDRGVVAVLDPRLAKAGYRWDLVRALPPMRRTRHRSDVEAFLASTAEP